MIKQVIQKWQKQKAFTLLEVSIALLVIAALALSSSKALLKNWQWSLADQFAVEKWAIADYAVKYRLDNADWPGWNGSSSCNASEAIYEMWNEGYLRGMDVNRGNTADSSDDVINSSFGMQYSLSCDDETFTIEHVLDESAGVDKERVAKYIAAKMPLTVAAISTGTDWKTTTTVTSPSSMDILKDYMKGIYQGRAKNLGDGEIISQISYGTPTDKQFKCPAGYSGRVEVVPGAFLVGADAAASSGAAISLLQTGCDAYNVRMADYDLAGSIVGYEEIDGLGCDYILDGGYSYGAGVYQSSSTTWQVRVKYSTRTTPNYDNLNNSSTSGWNTATKLKVHADKWCIRDGS